MRAQMHTKKTTWAYRRFCRGALTNTFLEPKRQNVKSCISSNIIPLWLFHKCNVSLSQVGFQILTNRLSHHFIDLYIKTSAFWLLVFIDIFISHVILPLMTFKPQQGVWTSKQRFSWHKIFVVRRMKDF